MMSTEVEDGMEPGTRVGYRYRIVELHRGHPIGELYRCVDETSDEPCLLQRLRREFSSPVIRARLFETRGDAALESPEIDDLLDYGEDIDGRLFLVTEWRDEPSLDAVERPLGFDEALAILVRVARALAPLHAKRLVHGAIEPSNLLVDDERELVSLRDFGLVPALDGGARVSAGPSKILPLLVSAHYASPELIRGESLEPASDVYALGVLAWELLLGRAPFRGPTLKVFDGHLNRPLPGFERPFDMPSSFEWLLRRMLAKSSVDRFSDASEVLAELEVYLHAAPVMALDVSGVDAEFHGDAKAVNEDEDEGETVLFTRGALTTEPSEGKGAGEAIEELEADALDIVAWPETDPAASVADSGHARVVDIDEWQPRKRRGPRLLAAACALSCLGLLAFIGMGDLQSSAASETTEPAPAQAQVQALEPESGARQAEQRVEPAAVLAAPTPASVEAVLPDLDPEAAPQRHKLLDSSFRSKKGELYRRVGVRCVSGEVRRTVKIAVRVGSDGSVEAANAMGGMGKTKLGNCVARQARKLEYPQTAEGGFYVYTVRIR